MKKRKKSKKTRKKNKIRKNKKLKKRGFRRQKVRKSSKTTKSLLKRLDPDNFLGSIKPKIKFKFNIKNLLRNLISPALKQIQNYKKNKERFELKKKRDVEKQKKQELYLRNELLKKEIKEEKALAKTRAAELKSFIKEEQKAIREKEKV